MEDHSNVLHRILDTMKQPAPKGKYRSTVIKTPENEFSTKTQISSSERIEKLASTSNQRPHILTQSMPSSNNHMPQLRDLSLAGGTVHTDRLLPQIEELSVVLRNFAPALKRLRLPICSNYVFKVRNYQTY